MEATARTPSRVEVVSAADGADSSATIAADFESRRHADLRPSTGPRAVAHIRGALWPNLTAGSREAPLGGRMAAKNPEARRVCCVTSIKSSR